MMVASVTGAERDDRLASRSRMIWATAASRQEDLAERVSVSPRCHLGLIYGSDTASRRVRAGER
jgi:hypothetical protein